MVEEAKVVKQRRVSSIWIIPGIALVLGGAMLFRAVFMADPVIQIRFETANGIEAGKTKIKIKQVEIGVVEEVSLSEDGKGVSVSARIDRSVRHLLRVDSRFWVVRPRIGSGGISGIGTLLSGGFIEMEAGSSDSETRSFVGLEDVPAIPSDASGIRVRALSEDIGNLKVGDPVLFRGKRTGRVNAVRFDPEEMIFDYELYIAPPYDSLVMQTTRFWKASAIEVKVDADGFAFAADSLESIMAGGVEFDVPHPGELGQAAIEGDSFLLYESEQEVDKYPYYHYNDFLVMFDSSVRGLKIGAPVEYRGIPIGEVVEVSFRYFEDKEMLSSGEVPIPVLIRLYPGNLEMGDTASAVRMLSDALVEHVREDGLRATLQRGNLLTGALFVSLDFFQNADEAEVGQVAGFTVLPSQSIGLEDIERRVVRLLARVEEIPIRRIVEEASSAMRKVDVAMQAAEVMMKDIDSLIVQDEVQALPATLREALASVSGAMSGFEPDTDIYREMERFVRELNGTLERLDLFVRRIEAKPNELLFSSPSDDDPKPRKDSR